MEGLDPSVAARGRRNRGRANPEWMLHRRALVVLITVLVLIGLAGIGLSLVR